MERLGYGRGLKGEGRKDLFIPRGLRMHANMRDIATRFMMAKASWNCNKSENAMHAGICSYNEKAWRQ